jgi:hypothetical protein
MFLSTLQTFSTRKKFLFHLISLPCAHVEEAREREMNGCKDNRFGQMRIMKDAIVFIFQLKV